MQDLARVVTVAGLVLLAVGLMLFGADRLHLPLGRLPGDLSWRGRNWSVSFPVVTSLIISVVLSLILWLLNYLRR